MNAKLDQAVPSSRNQGTFSDKLLTALTDLKTRLHLRYERKFPRQAAAIHRAINEAWAIAWQSSLPQLVFASVAEERVARLVAPRLYRVENYQALLRQAA